MAEWDWFFLESNENGWFLVQLVYVLEIDRNAPKTRAHDRSES